MLAARARWRPSRSRSPTAPRRPSPSPYRKEPPDDRAVRESLRAGCAMSGWRRNLAIFIAAVAGLVLAAALTTAASTVSGQSVGLSSEPLTAGRGLAPA